MKRRTVLSMSAAALASPMLAQAQAPTVVKWWYHFDNPQASPADLIAKFERENPGIKIQAESIPWVAATTTTRAFMRPWWQAPRLTVPWSSSPTSRACCR